MSPSFRRTAALFAALSRHEGGVLLAVTPGPHPSTPPAFSARPVFSPLPCWGQRCFPGSELRGERPAPFRAKSEFSLLTNPRRRHGSWAGRRAVEVLGQAGPRRRSAGSGRWTPSWAVVLPRQQVRPDDHLRWNRGEGVTARGHRGGAVGGGKPRASLQPRPAGRPRQAGPPPVQGLRGSPLRRRRGAQAPPPLGRSLAGGGGKCPRVRRGVGGAPTAPCQTSPAVLLPSPHGGGGGGLWSRPLRHQQYDASQIC